MDTQTNNSETDLQFFTRAVRFVNRLITMQSIADKVILAPDPFGAGFYIDGKAVGNELFREGDKFTPRALCPIDGELKFVFGTPMKAEKSSIAAGIRETSEIFPEYFGEIQEALNNSDFAVNDIYKMGVKFLRDKPLAASALTQIIREEILSVWEQHAERESVEKIERGTSREDWGNF